MEVYIGTKIIEAAPAVRKGGKVYDLTWPIPRSMEPEEPGYRVRYPDGYESWSPKDVFERAYLPVTINPDLRTEAPSISQQMVLASIRLHQVGDIAPAAHINANE